MRNEWSSDIYSLFHLDLLLNLKSQPTLIWELHLLISCDHRLATDNKNLTKINKSILWESIGCVEFTTENIICFIIGYKLCYLYHMSIIFINLGMHRYTHIGFVERWLSGHSCLKRAGSFQPPGFCVWSLHLFSLLCLSNFYSFLDLQLKCDFFKSLPQFPQVQMSSPHYAHFPCATCINYS